jgi:hypothetical protein
MWSSGVDDLGMTSVEADPPVIACCPHCIHGPGYVHKLPCLRPGEHPRVKASDDR